MDTASVKTLLQGHLPDCEIYVEGDGSHYDIIAIGEVFEGLRPVKKQQLVYGALKEQISDGSIHAVNIRTYTPAQWREQAGD
jgi:acid stress-induced BolA-like protein IbaG/YrbA